MLVLTEDELKAAAHNINGEIYASNNAASLSGNQSLAKITSLRMLSSSNNDAKNQLASFANKFGLGGVNSSHNSNMWLNTWTSSSEIKGNKNAAKTDVSNVGMLLGFDAPLNEGTTVGLWQVMKMAKQK